MNLRPLYLEDGPHPVFCLLHPAAAPRDAAVLLCPPFGWEEMCSARARFEWAEDLAARGYTTMRLDLPGTGDSGGSPWDEGLFDAWVTAVGSAARRLREETGASRIIAIGIGLGALLTCLAAARSADAIDELVLWSVTARGSRIIRELRAFAKLEVGEVPPAPAGVPSGIPDGGVAAGGFAMSPETVEALSAVDIAQLDLRPRRVLMLGRDSKTVDEPVREALERASAEVTVASGDGYTQMVVVPPQESRPPLAAFDRVGAWLDEGAVERDGAGRAPQHALAGAAAELAANGTRLRETVISIEQESGEFIGVLTEPLRDPPAITVVLLNAGSQRRIGPNRMWVEMARRWAARGVATLRLDLAGIGDSGGDARRFEDDAAFYVPEFIDQAKLALDVLEARGLGPRFVLGGLCSSAYWSLYAAIEDERVGAALMLNPRALTWDSESRWVAARREIQALGRKLVSRSAWSRVLTGKASYSRPFRIGAYFFMQLLRAPLRLRGRLHARRRAREVGADDIDLVFDRLRDSGKRGLLVFVGREPLHAEFRRAGRMARFDRWPNITVEVRELGADTHTLRALWLQREVHAFADAALERELELVTGPALAVPQPARRAT